jgi:hypothetical protein
VSGDFGHSGPSHHLDFRQIVRVDCQWHHFPPAGCPYPGRYLRDHLSGARSQEQDELVRRALTVIPFDDAEGRKRCSAEVEIVAVREAWPCEAAHGGELVDVSTA